MVIHGDWWWLYGDSMVIDCNWWWFMVIDGDFMVILWWLIVIDGFSWWLMDITHGKETICNTHIFGSGGNMFTECHRRSRLYLHCRNSKDGGQNALNRGKVCVCVCQSFVKCLRMLWVATSMHVKPGHKTEILRQDMLVFHLKLRSNPSTLKNDKKMHVSPQTKT